VARARTPLSIAIVGWLFVVVGVSGLGASAKWVYDAAREGRIDALDAHEWRDFGYAAASRLLALVGGAFLLKGKSWARWVLLAWMAFHIVLSVMHSWSMLLVHCAIFAPITYLLFRRSASEYLAGTASRGP
jgi:hypothetical protein